MNYKKSLEYLGLVENVDFVLTESLFEMVVKTHQVEIQPAVYATGEEITQPEVLDEQGNVVSEAIYAEVGSLISEAVFEEQEYVPSAPSQEQLDAANIQVELNKVDIVLLIELYLSDKSELRDPENDSINIVDNRIFNWGFVNIRRPTDGELFNLIPSLLNKQSKDEILSQIKELESQITPRRIREAVLSNDNSFIADIDAQIKSLRSTI